MVQKGLKFLPEPGRQPGIYEQVGDFFIAHIARKEQLILLDEIIKSIRRDH